VTIPLPPPLLKKAEKVASEENRTKSELLREALRFYVETREVRRLASRERLFALINRVQARASRMPTREIRKLVREAVESVRLNRPIRFSPVICSMLSRRPATTSQQP
jgi:metal-responsive CopG/Arc/MetJ family transcriptional regulator